MFVGASDTLSGHTDYYYPPSSNTDTFPSLSIFNNNNNINTATAPPGFNGTTTSASAVPTFKPNSVFAMSNTPQTAKDMSPLRPSSQEFTPPTSSHMMMSPPPAPGSGGSGNGSGRPPTAPMSIPKGRRRKAHSMNGHSPPHHHQGHHHHQRTPPSNHTHSSNNPTSVVSSAGTDCSDNNGSPPFGSSPSDKQSSLYKTELCRSFEETGHCRYGNKCQFAHGNEELRSVNRHPKYKTEICKTFHTIGTCPYGKRCRFIHTERSISDSPLISQLDHNAVNHPIEPQQLPDLWLSISQTSTPSSSPPSVGSGFEAFYRSRSVSYSAVEETPPVKRRLPFFEHMREEQDEA